MDASRSFLPEVLLVQIDLASEMAAARQRRDERTARLLRESRVRAIQASVRPGSSREEIEERARSELGMVKNGETFYLTVEQ